MFISRSRPTGPFYSDGFVFPKGGPGEGASRRTSADPSGFPMIIFAKQAAPCWAESLGGNCDRGPGRLEWVVAPEPGGSSPQMAPQACKEPRLLPVTPCLGQVSKVPAWAVCLRKYEGWRGLVYSALAEACCLPGTLWGGGERFSQKGMTSLLILSA